MKSKNLFKKLSVLALVFIMIFALAACSNDTATEDDTQAVTVVSLETVDDQEVAYGTAVEDVPLPAEVEATFSDDSTDDLAVAWESDDYTADVPGDYTFVGSVEYEGEVTNTNDVTVTVLEEAGVENQSFLRVWYNDDDEIEIYEDDTLYLVHGETDRNFNLMFHNRGDQFIAESFVVDHYDIAGDERLRVWSMPDDTITLAEDKSRVLEDLQEEYAFDGIMVNDDDRLELRVDENGDGEPDFRDDIAMVVGVAVLTDADGNEEWVTYTDLQGALDAAGDEYTVTLYDDVTEDVTINNEDLTLDINGNTITGDVGVAADGVTITGSTITGDLTISADNVTATGITLTGNAIFANRSANNTYTGTRGAGSVYLYATVQVKNANELFDALQTGENMIVFDEDIEVDYTVEIQHENVTIDLNGYNLSHETPVSSPSTLYPITNWTESLPMILINEPGAKIVGPSQNRSTIESMGIYVRAGLRDTVIKDVDFSGFNAILLGADPVVSPDKTTLNLKGDINTSGTLAMASLSLSLWENDYAFIGNDATIGGAGTVIMGYADFDKLTFEAEEVGIVNWIRLGDVTFEEDVNLQFVNANVYEPVTDPNVYLRVLNNKTVKFNNVVDTWNLNLPTHLVIDAYLDTGALSSNLTYTGTITGSGEFDLNNNDSLLMLSERIRVLDFDITGGDINVAEGNVYFEDISGGQFSRKVNVGQNTHSGLDEATLHLLDNFPLNTSSNVINVYGNGTLEGRENTITGSSGQVNVVEDEATISNVTIEPDLDLSGFDVNFQGIVETNNVLNADNITVTLVSNPESKWIMNEDLIADPFTLAGKGEVDGHDNIFDGSSGPFIITGDITLKDTGWKEYSWVDVENSASLTFEGTVENDDILSVAGMLYGVENLDNALGLTLNDYVAIENTDFTFSAVPFFIDGSTTNFNVYSDFSPITITLPADSKAEWTADADDSSYWPSPDVQSVVRVDNKTIELTVGDPGSAWNGVITGFAETNGDVIRTFKYKSHVIRGIEVDLGFISAEFDLELQSSAL